MADGHGGIQHLTSSVGGQALRNWFVDRVIQYGANAYKTDPDTKQVRPEYLQVLYLLQQHTEASRAAVIAMAQGLHELWHLIPYDRLPFDKYSWLRPAMDFSHEQFKQSCEQLPDSLRIYAADQKMVFPDGFKPMSAEEVAGAFGGWLKENLLKAPAALVQFIINGIPELIEKVSGFNVHLPQLGGTEEAGVDYLKSLESHPRLLKQWLEFVRQLPRDAEDDVRRIGAALSPVFIRTLLKMEREHAVDAIRRLAKDTFEENMDAAVADVVKPINRVLDRWQAGLRDRLAKFDGPHHPAVGATSPGTRVESISIRSYELIRQPDLDEVIRFGR